MPVSFAEKRRRRGILLHSLLRVLPPEVLVHRVAVPPEEGVGVVAVPVVADPAVVGNERH